MLDLSTLKNPKNKINNHVIVVLHKYKYLHKPYPTSEISQYIIGMKKQEKKLFNFICLQYKR